MFSIRRLLGNNQNPSDITSNSQDPSIASNSNIQANSPGNTSTQSNNVESKVTDAAKPVLEANDKKSTVEKTQEYIFTGSITRAHHHDMPDGYDREVGD